MPSADSRKKERHLIVSPFRRSRRELDAAIHCFSAASQSPLGPSRILPGAAALVLLWAANANAEAWTQPVGKTFLKTSISAHTADGYYDDNGNAQDGDWWDPQSSYREATISQILEYGWRDDVTFLFDARFRSLVADRGTSDRGNDQVSGLGDVGLGLRKKLPTKKLAAALQGRVEIPGGYDPERRDYSLGAGEVNLEGRFQLGGTVGGSRRNWWNGEAGYRLRGGDFGDEIVFLLEAGVGIAGSLSAQLGFDLLSALETTFVDLEDPAQRDPLQSASRASVGGGLRWSMTPGATLAVGYSSDVAGENSLQGQTVEFAVELRP